MEHYSAMKTNELLSHEKDTNNLNAYYYLKEASLFTV